ncbi:adhesion G protein-coupled receptor A3 [Eurytemora carolleeae]|uniref:adhesion G protein-coupled receptor A3 n=1 Tax=Eurytemora carolleeae TaxID=1294199 RepID=UPI000C7749BC|nr:adhesion G protein-coupled receptor A3 [Eurytemora carolleeae]|eukprot:XP_023340161.1 adhesion G protein-coupled receptor A3-like [Eurytemora affinis]
MYCTARLSCTLSQSKEEAILSWSVNGNAVSGPEVLVSQINPVLEEAGGTHSSIYIRSVGMDYAGKWSCRALLQSGYSEERSVLVQIMSPGTILCPWSTTKSSKGVYNWPVTLAGQSSTLDCTKGEETTSKIVHFCDDEGHWTGLNESECRHTNDVTDKLSRFSTMNHSRFDPVTLDQAAEKLLEFTSNPDIFLDSQDIVYLTKVDRQTDRQTDTQANKQINTYISIYIYP